MEDGAWRIARLVVKPSIVLRDPTTATRNGEDTPMILEPGERDQAVVGRLRHS